MNLYDAGVVWNPQTDASFEGSGNIKKIRFKCLSMTFHCCWVEEHTKIYSPIGCLDLKFLQDRKFRLASPKLTANELKISRSPKDKNRLPIQPSIFR